MTLQLTGGQKKNTQNQFTIMNKELKEMLEEAARVHSNKSYCENSIPEDIEIAFMSGAEWMHNQLRTQPDKPELIIGKRYWLDSMKDESGVYVGRNTKGVYLFRPDGNVRFYTLDDNGLIGFSSFRNFYEV